MCGILSLWSDEEIQPNLFQIALDTLVHRGPDDEGAWFSDNRSIGLGHKRLSIIDLDYGHQPFSNEDEKIHLVVNGEFYDFENIRRDLIERGHKFSSHSDSEVALHLYEEYGLDFVHHLRGEFALVLYDQNKNQMIAVRDRFGIKPLCFAKDERALYIASEAKAIFAAGYKARWDRYAFLHACHVQYTPQDRTLFEGISQLKPGHILIYDGSDVRIKKYWDMDYPQGSLDRISDEQAHIEAFTAQFKAAIKLRLRSDAPVCFHLSGGLDSSAVAALGMDLQGKPMDCFTVAFEQNGYNELPFAQELANEKGANLHVVPVSQDDLVHVISDAVYHSEGLAINGHLAGKFLLSKAIREAGFKVALTGEGADEVLAGYPHFREDLLSESDPKTLKALYDTNEKLAGVFLAHGDALPRKAVEEALGFVPSFLRAKASLGFRVNQLLSDAFKTGQDIYAKLISDFDVSNQLQGRNVVDQSSYLWSKLALTNYILRTLGDGCEMAHSIEGRVPFLDHHLFEHLRNVPMGMKIKGMTEKYILREAAKPYITKTIYERQKHPFIAPPVTRFSNSALNEYIQDTLRSDDFAAMPFWDQPKVLHWLDIVPDMDAKEQAASEPVLMMILSSFLIHQRFNLSA